MPKKRRRNGAGKLFKPGRGVQHIQDGDTGTISSIGRKGALVVIPGRKNPKRIPLHQLRPI